MFMFNVAFVQSELVTQILQLGENQRSVAGMEAAAKELDEAVQYVFFPSIFELPSRISHDLGYVHAFPTTLAMSESVPTRFGH